MGAVSPRYVRDQGRQQWGQEHDKEQRRGGRWGGPGVDGRRRRRGWGVEVSGVVRFQLAWESGGLRRRDSSAQVSHRRTLPVRLGRGPGSLPVCLSSGMKKAPSGNSSGGRTPMPAR